MAGRAGSAYHVRWYTNDHVDHAVAVAVVRYQRRQGSRDRQGVRTAQSVATILALRKEINKVYEIHSVKTIWVNRGSISTRNFLNN